MRYFPNAKDQQQHHITDGKVDYKIVIHCAYSSVVGKGEAYKRICTKSQDYYHILCNSISERARAFPRIWQGSIVSFRRVHPENKVHWLTKLPLLSLFLKIYLFSFSFSNRDYRVMTEGVLHQNRSWKVISIPANCSITSNLKGFTILASSYRAFQ